MRRYFKLGSTATKFELCDVLKKEFREYQTYKVEERKGEHKEKKKRLQYSDWKYAYVWFVRHKQTTDKLSEQCIKIDNYWLKVYMMFFTVSAKNTTIKILSKTLI